MIELRPKLQRIDEHYQNKSIPNIDYRYTTQLSPRFHTLSRLERDRLKFCIVSEGYGVTKSKLDIPFTGLG